MTLKSNRPRCAPGPLGKLKVAARENADPACALTLYYRRRMSLWAIAGRRLLALLPGLVFSAVCQAAPSRYSGRLEVGPEYDTNPVRVEVVRGAAASPVAASPLGRIVLSSDVLVPVADRATVSASAAAAGKRFVRDDVRTEDVALVQASASVSVSLGETSSLSLLGGYYDVFARASVEARDFRSATPALRWDQSLWGGVLMAGGGQRFFTYKANRDFSFSGPSLFSVYRRALSPASGSRAADWEGTVAATLERRTYEGGRCATAEDCPTAAGAPRRLDTFSTAQLDLTRTTDVLLGAGLAAHVNASNSYGETLYRGLVHVRGAVLLPWHVSATGRVDIVFTRYAQSVPLARNAMTGTPLASIEDESRSVLRLELVRPATDWLDLGARYTLYTNELRSGPVTYRRQTFLLFLAVSYGNDR